MGMNWVDWNKKAIKMVWNQLVVITLSIERNPFSAQNQTLRSYGVYLSPTKQASSALIQNKSSNKSE